MSIRSIQTPLYKVKVQTKDKVKQPKIKGIQKQPKTKVNNKPSGPTKYATTKKNHEQTKNHLKKHKETFDDLFENHY